MQCGHCACSSLLRFCTVPHALRAVPGNVSSLATSQCFKVGGVPSGPDYFQPFGFHLLSQGKAIRPLFKHRYRCTGWDLRTFTRHSDEGGGRCGRRNCFLTCSCSCACCSGSLPLYLKELEWKVIWECDFIHLAVLDCRQPSLWGKRRPCLPTVPYSAV